MIRNIEDFSCKVIDRIQLVTTAKGVSRACANDISLARDGFKVEKI
jgi:hypothetical protein